MTTHLLRAPAPRHARYVPDLNHLLEQCEQNYLTLTAWCARASSVCEGELKQTAVALQVLERDRYTTTLQLDEVRSPSHFHGRGPQFIVRLYHDVKLAEVLQLHNRRILKGSYPYPNKAMLQRDEKQRVNDFLAEWLVSCQQRHLPLYAELNGIRRTNG